jgi:hypothetical protein
MGFIRSYLGDLKLALGVSSPPIPRTNKHRETATLGWNAPPQGLCKINVDAALSKTKIGGAVGVVCRDEQGVLLGASARVIEGVNDPTTLEA